jgi:hypothetical protein
MRLWDMLQTWREVVRKSHGKRSLGDIGIDGRIILN